MSQLNDDPNKRNFVSNRKPWLLATITFALLICLCLVALSPSLFAQTRTNSGTSGSSDEDQIYLSTMQALQDFIQENYVDPVDAKTLYEGALKGMFEALGDPYSLYMDSQEMSKLNDTTTGEFGGLGMYVDKQRSTDGKLIPQGFVEIVSPIEGTPAYEAGIQAGDLIVEIDGKSTGDMTLDEAVSKLRGPIDSQVEIRVFRGQAIDFKKTFTRKAILIPTVRSALIGDIAYLRITQFTPITKTQMEENLTKLNKSGYKGLIIDLRNNPGGVLDGAVDVADMFFDDGVLVSTKSRVRFENQVFNAKKGVLVKQNIPIVCLINEGSASAAEILSGALKDRGRALFVGTKTYGKGSVQTVRSLGDTGFKLTIAKYYTPANISIDKIGISPDIEIKAPEFSREEELAYLKLIEGDYIGRFADAYGSNLKANTKTILDSLAKEGIKLPESIVMRLIQRELDHRANVVRDYDLEYDEDLKQAIDLIHKNKVQQLINERKPVQDTKSKDTLLPLPNSK